jgi:hypothetical protein
MSKGGPRPRRTKPVADIIKPKKRPVGGIGGGPVVDVDPEDYSCQLVDIPRSLTPPLREHDVLRLQPGAENELGAYRGDAKVGRLHNLCVQRYRELGVRSVIVVALGTSQKPNPVVRPT